MIKRDAFAINFSGGAVAGLVLQERHQRDNQVTEHPVDVGAPVTDHVRAAPNTLTLSILFSETPVTYGTDGTGWAEVSLPVEPLAPTPVFSPGTALAAGVSQGIAALAGAFGASPKPGPSVRVLDWQGVDFLREAWNALTAIRDGAELVQVVTGTVTYDGVVLQSFSWARSSESLTATAELVFREVRKASTRTVALPKVKSPAAAPKKVAGKAKTTAPAPARGSMLHSMLKDTGVL